MQIRTTTLGVLVCAVLGAGCGHRGDKSGEAAHPDQASMQAREPSQGGARALGGSPMGEGSVVREFTDAQLVSILDAFCAEMISEAQYAQTHAIDLGVKKYADRAFENYVNARRNLQFLGLGTSPNPTSQWLLQKASADLTAIRNASGFEGGRACIQQQIADLQQFQQMLNERLVPSASSPLLARLLTHLNEQPTADTRDAVMLNREQSEPMP